MDLMSKIAFPSNSPYHATPQTSWYTKSYVFRPISPDAGDTPFQLQQQHQYRPDRLSQDLYGTPSYWWIFCVRNPFLRSDPIWGFVSGLTIMVPTLIHIEQAVGR
jgi:hypothetical protein